jgi:phospholipid-translocating ATPase
MVDREERMAAEQERIEHGLHLVGATAVEDRLQDGVPACLVALAAAGIKVWVLTGACVRMRTCVRACVRACAG